ncbi:MAG: primosomal protein N' [Desulfuromonas sp.]|nr:primosomal protein N' [Desulfuromonas sp.]
MENKRHDCVVVALLAPLPQPLTYAVPEELRDLLRIGHRVCVPLGRRSAVGVVLELCTDVTPPSYKLKPVTRLLDTAPVVDVPLLEFVRRASSYYIFPLGLALKTALPAGLASIEGAPKCKHTTLYTCRSSKQQVRGALQKKILAFIAEHESVDIAQLRQNFPAPYAALARLQELGLIEAVQCETQRDPFLGISVSADSAWTLNTEQELACAAIVAAVATQKFSPFLLHGVTGSGKTEVYLQAIAAVVKTDKQALVLVPEIALTPQLVGRFRARFEQQQLRIGVLHSGLSAAERYDMWRAIMRGEVHIVIGARSAVFAPLPSLGIIVVDEEHDGSYKQSEGFRYHGRDLALMRGQMAKVSVVLGSATPSLASWQRAQQGLLTHLSLTDRVGARPLPEVTLIDMAAAEVESGLSQQLRSAIGATLERHEQCLLLLNRRGYAPYLLCGDCGASYRCPNCEITLTWHRQIGQLRCHYCDYQQPPQELCPQCGGSAMEPEGMGTERLVDELQQLFPAARIARMDRDTTSAKGSQQRIFTQMERREVDILVGTQMIAKGHDFAAVTLVGVIDTDAALNFPDFRAAERSFSLLAQVAGRAGRGELLGQVLVQTYAADNPVLECAVGHDFHRFAAQELPLRQLLHYPPFGYLVNLLLSSLDRQALERSAQALADQLAGHAQVEVLGPAPCPLFRLRNRYRMQILLKAEERSALRRMLLSAPDWYKIVAKKVTLAIDVDPVDMM